MEPLSAVDKPMIEESLNNVDLQVTEGRAICISQDSEKSYHKIQVLARPESHAPIAREAATHKASWRSVTALIFCKPHITRIF